VSAYLIKQHVTAMNCNGDMFVHAEGSVVSDWELSDFIRAKIQEGSEHYRERFEPLTDAEAHHYRAQATMAEGPRRLEGQTDPIKPPWDDYVGLHPTEIVDRMRAADRETIRQAKLYEQAGFNRTQIVDYVHPSDREPFSGYDSWTVRQVLEKFAVTPDTVVRDALAYERAHKNRDAITEWDRATYDGVVEEKGSGIVAGAFG
jgi:hypothetical protein